MHAVCDLRTPIERLVDVAEWALSIRRNRGAFVLIAPGSVGNPSDPVLRGWHSKNPRHFRPPSK